MAASIGLAFAALLALGMMSAWRDTKNWAADGEGGALRFTAWAEFSAFGTAIVIVALCSVLLL